MYNHNILKSWTTGQMQGEEKTTRMIDSNAKIHEKMQAFEEQKKKELALQEQKNTSDEVQDDEFVEGLLFKELGQEEIDSENVIGDGKADDNIEALLQDGPRMVNPAMTAEEFMAKQEMIDEQLAQIEEKKKDLEQREQSVQSALKNLEGRLEELALKEQEVMTEREQILAKTMEEAQALKTSAFEEGKKSGFEEGQREASKILEEGEAELAERKQELENRYETLIEHLEPDFVETLTGIYRHIFEVDFSKHKDVILQLTMKALRALDSSKDYMIHVSKEDYPFVNMNKNKLQAAAKGDSVVDIVEDVTLHDNECMIETENGIYDCSLGIQLDELEKQLKILSYDTKKE